MTRELERRSARAARAVGWFVLLVAVAAPADAVFETRDLNRPLVVDRIDPDLAEPLAGLYGLDPEVIWRSLVKADEARDSFDLHVYRATTAGLGLKYLGESLQEFPGNPFAWVQLGADLALYQQPAAAIAATERGLGEIPDHLDGLDEATLEAVERLRHTSALNLALYRLMLDRYDRALDALEQAGNPAELDPLRRLVFYWTAARAYGGRGDEQLAGQALGRAESIPHESLVAFQAAAMKRKALLSDSYPQYFKESLRRANHQYIRGLIELGAGDPEAALGALKQALAVRDNLWDARFSLATALLLTGQNDPARTELEDLTSVQLKKFYRPERIFFNLGNVERQAGRWQKAVEHYERAIKLAEKADRVFRKHYKRYAEAFPPDGAAAQLIDPMLPGASKTFPEARTNLALTYLELHQLHPRRGYARRAEGELCRALEDPDYRDAHIARQHLANLYLDQGRRQEALEQIRLTLQNRPSYSPALRELFTLITELDEPAAEVEATAVLVRALERMQPAYACRRYGSWIEAIRPRLAESEDAAVLVTALERLSRDSSEAPGPADWLQSALKALDQGSFRVEILASVERPDMVLPAVLEGFETSGRKMEVKLPEAIAGSPGDPAGDRPPGAETLPPADWTLIESRDQEGFQRALIDPEGVQRALAQGPAKEAGDPLSIRLDGGAEDLKFFLDPSRLIETLSGRVGFAVSCVAGDAVVLTSDDASGVLGPGVQSIAEHLPLIVELVLSPETALPLEISLRTAIPADPLVSFRFGEFEPPGNPTAAR